MSDLKQRYDHRIPDLSQPSRAGFAYLLRHQELWPKDFGNWNYADVCHCGIGLAIKMWPGQIGLGPGWTYVSSLADIFGISLYRASQIFYYGSGDYPGNGLMPEQMADMLESGNGD